MGIAISGKPRKSTHLLSLAQDTQADKSDLLLIFRQDRLARERNLPENPRFVTDIELAQTAELHREAIHSKVVKKCAFKA